MTKIAAILAMAVVLALGGGRAHAAGWRMEPGLVTDVQVERLAERYPSLDGPDALEGLLRDIGRRLPTLKLEARFENGVWVISGKRAPIIADIEIDVVSRALRNPIYAALQNYLGQIDSPEVQTKMLEVVQKYLKKRGFPKAKVKLEPVTENGEVVYKIRVSEGNPCVVERFELGFRMPDDVDLDVKAGDICDREEIEAALSDLELQLRERGYNQLKIELSDIVYDLDHDTAVVYVSGVLGQRVRYEIVDETKRFLIDDLFADEELTKVDPTIVGPDAMAAELARRYRNRGFSDVVVKGPDVKKSGEDEFVYVFNVDPGRQYILKSVQFEGVTVFSEEELLGIMGLKSLWQTNRPLNLDEIQTGLDALRARYQQEGYWDVEIRDPGGGQKDKETGTVRLVIQVEEGLQRVLHGVNVSGNEALTTAEIRALLPIAKGAPLDRSKLVDLQQAIRTSYLNRGYLYADAQIKLEAKEVRRRIEVDVGIKIVEGPRVKIGEITITGLVRTDSKVVRRELLFDTGEWYDPDKIARSRVALTGLGIFRSVQITPADRNAMSDKERELDIMIDVREGKAGSVSFGPGWSLVRGWSYEAEASYSNIGGAGRQASVRGAFSEEKNQEAIGNKTLVGRKFATGYLEPWIFDLPIDAVFSANQKAEWGDGLWALSYGGEVALQHTLRYAVPGSKVSTFYGQRIAKSEGSEKSVDELVATDVRIGQVGVRYNLDRRDNLKFPTDGYTFNTELAWARYGLGGDLRYFRWDVGTGFYQKIVTDLVFAVGINLTSYEGIQRKQEDLIGILPPTERLPAGGSESVRGYAPASLGPLVRSPTFSKAANGGCSIGYKTDELNGNRRTEIKTELRHKVNESFAVTAFVDNGISFFTQDQMDKFEEEYSANVVTPDPDEPQCAAAEAYRSVEDNIGYEYRDLLLNPGYILSRHYYSYGFSFNLLTAVGSINFGYGLPWKQPETEKCQRDPAFCYPRGKQGGHWIQRGEFHLNVGARF